MISIDKVFYIFIKNVLLLRIPKNDILIQTIIIPNSDKVMTKCGRLGCSALSHQLLQRGQLLREVAQPRPVELQPSQAAHTLDMLWKVATL